MHRLEVKRIALPRRTSRQRRLNSSLPDDFKLRFVRHCRMEGQFDEKNNK